MLKIGKVKWFNNTKKYGFLIVEQREVFVHFSAILKEGYKTLKKDQIVECDIVQSAKGEMAINVKLLSGSKLAQKDQAFFPVSERKLEAAQILQGVSQ